MSKGFEGPGELDEIVEDLLQDGSDPEAQIFIRDPAKMAEASLTVTSAFLSRGKKVLLVTPELDVVEAVHAVGLPSENPYLDVVNPRHLRHIRGFEADAVVVEDLGTCNQEEMGTVVNAVFSINPDARAVYLWPGMGSRQAPPIGRMEESQDGEVVVHLD